MARGQHEEKLQVSGMSVEVISTHRVELEGVDYFDWSNIYLLWMGNSVKAMSFIGSSTELQLLTCQLLQHFIQQLCVYHSTGSFWQTYHASNHLIILYQHDQRNGKISQTNMWAVSGYVTQGGQYLKTSQKLNINNEQWSEEHDCWISTLTLYCQNNCRLVAAIQVSKAVSQHKTYLEQISGV